MPETIKVLLHAQLRYYNGGREETTLPYTPGATVGDYLDQLDIPGHEHAGVIIDGRLSGDRTIVVGSGAVLELVPAISGG
jgi:hypothetical protein